MKKKILFIILSVIVITGCNKTVNETKTTLSCYHDFTLFHSKQHIENKIYLDKNNKLIEYEYIEIYTDFDSDNEFNMICDGSAEEATNNNKMYDYLNQTADCNRDTRVVKISNKYDLSKVTSKNNLEGKNMREYLNDEYVLDIENYKNSLISKGYICK